METRILPKSPAALTSAQFQQLAAVPPEVEWFANLTNPNTRRAYQADVCSFMAFLGITQPAELRQVTRAHILAWRKRIGGQAPATVRRKLAAISSLFAYLCDANTVAGNPASGVQRPKEGANEGKTPAISDAAARKLLNAPSTDTVAGKRDRAMISVFCFTRPDGRKSPVPGWGICRIVAGCRTGVFAEKAAKSATCLRIRFQSPP